MLQLRFLLVQMPQLLKVNEQNFWSYLYFIKYHNSFICNFLNTDISFSWEGKFILLFKNQNYNMLRVNNNQNRIRAVIFEYFIDFNIMLLELSTGSIPPNNFFFSIDFFIHAIHFFMVKMIHEPNMLFLRIFFKRKCITIGYI